VSVVVEFNQWSVDSPSLAAESNDYWSCNVAEAKPDQSYTLVLRNPA
jgi:1,4-alpha-glucan branching enzyme